MKDSEFIELLNLYLDHEISAADAVRLEAEVQSNPARRRIYQDYCRMQKACKIVAQDFQSETSDAAEKKVVPFRPDTVARASRGNAFYTVGAFAAAAACVAIIFVGRSRQQANEAARNQPVLAKMATASQPDMKDAVATPVSINAPAAHARAGVAAVNPVRRNDGVSATFVGSNAFFLGHHGASGAITVSAPQPASDQFAWLQTNLGIVPLEQQMQLDQLRFQAPSTPLRPEGRALGGRAMNNKAQEPASEMVTFQLTLGR